MSGWKRRRQTGFSILVASLFMFNSICMLAKLIFPSVTDFGDTLMLIIVIGAIICFVPKIKFVNSALMINLFLSIWIILSYVLYDYAEEVYQILYNYVVWGVFASMVMMQDYDDEKSFNYMLFFSAIITAVMLMNTDIALDVDNEMTWTYSALPCLAVIFTHFVYKRKTLSAWKRIVYIIGLAMFFSFLQEANRGGIVSLVVLMYLLLIKTVNKRSNTVKNHPFLNIIALAILLFALIYYEEIVKLLYEYLESRDIRVFSIRKMYRGIVKDNITNNRDELYAFAWQGFKDSPFIGNGIGSFSVNHGGWPHNLFLQLLYEGGVALFLFLGGITVYITVFFITSKKITPTEYAIFVILFSTTIPRLMFSTELWKVQGFWMLLVYGLKCMQKYKDIGKLRE